MTLFFFFWNSIKAFKIQLHKKLPTRWIKRDKFEAARLHFLSDVFVTVAVALA